MKSPNASSVRLHVNVHSGGRNIFLAVSDPGTGIPEEKRARIFEPFFTPRQLGKGTGLGLAATYGIIKMHKGDISVQSNADPGAGPTGSSFTVRLPRRGEQD